MRVNHDWRTDANVLARRRAMIAEQRAQRLAVEDARRVEAWMRAAYAVFGSMFALLFLSTLLAHLTR